MKKLFILLVLTCALFSSADTVIGAPASRPVVISIRDTAEEFTRFVERAQQSPFSSKVCSKIADQLIRFCKFEGHYVEANPDLVNQNAYFGILLDDYSPLFTALQTFDRDPSSANANALFDCMLDIYTRNLRDQVKAARRSLADDLQFGTPEKSPMFYSANGLDFFRSPAFLPNYERFVGNAKIKGLTPAHTSILRQKRTELLRTKETQVEYRQYVEDHLNQLLCMTWKTVLDRNSLSSRTKAILANLPYVHPILKQGQCDQCNYDLLITDSVINTDNPLHRVFAIIQSHHATEATLPKVLLPNKKKVRKKKTAIPGNVSEPAGLPQLEDDDVEEVAIPDAALAIRGPTPTHVDFPGKDEVADTILAARSALEHSSPSSVLLKVEPEDEDVEEADLPDVALAAKIHPAPVDTYPEGAHPIIYQVKDWLNGRPVTLMYDLCSLVTNLQQRKISARGNDIRTKEARANDILALLNTFHSDKFVRYEVVQSLYAELGGVIVNQKGSHETWVFNEGANKVKTIFFNLHGKDQYGPWTKADVAQTILDVLKPYLVQL